jgi:DNA processing protein
MERLARYARHGIALLSLHDPAYPRPLLDLPSPPPLLYVLGELVAQDVNAVAIVGTRSPDARGAELAGAFARAFAERGVTIVSGLARGIDTAAHRGALEAEQGRSIAFLGCGLLRLYPPENVGLAGRIARHGALASEVPPETEVSRGLLLARDRLQAGMSRAVIVVQAHRKCGSLVTARHARQCGRLVFGVPWEKPPFSEGWEELQKLGARPVTADTDLDRLLDDAAPPPLEQQPLL